MISFPGNSSLPSVMNHSFAKVPQANIQRSSFNRSHGIKTTFDAGWLVPIFWDYAYPGDTHVLNGTLLARLGTPLKATMDNMVLDTFFFAVPFRLVLSTAAQLLGQIDDPQEDPYDPPPPNTHVVPQIVSDGTNNASGSLADYFGIPVNDGDGDPIVGLRYSALRFRAYNLIWNEWFRDQNQQDKVTVLLDEADDTTSFTLLRRGKRHDYFTSLLPWPQKATAVPLPIVGTASVTFPTDFPLRQTGWNTAQDGTGSSRGDTLQDPGAAVSGNLSVEFPGGGAQEKVYLQGIALKPTDATVDGASFTAPDLNEFFQAYALQQLYMADARGGSRLTELIFYHFGVSSPDMRLQRPEFIGGGSTPVNITPIPQTSVAAATPQGNLAGIGVGSGGGHSFTYSATEHCVIIGLACVRADLTYQQGLEREESVRTRFDFYWPSLANLGEQAVLSQEIYCADDQTGDTDVLGYQEAWGHLKYKRSSITGLFRSNVTGSLDIWHLSQDFASRPVLGPDFIQENPPVDRIIAVPSEPQFLLDAYFHYTSVRPMPVYSVPGIFNRF